MAVGLLPPTTGHIAVLGGAPGKGRAQLSRVGFLAQDSPIYTALTVADHLQLGARLNPTWDPALAAGRIDDLDIDRTQRAGTLSGGQRAQLALTLAVAKRPELLVLDEPVANLDPLARHEFLQALMETVADGGVSVVLSSHLVADLEQVCDYLIILSESQVRLAGDVDNLLATHRLLVGQRRDLTTLPAGQHVVTASHTDRQTSVVVRTDEPVLDPSWVVEDVGLEALVLAYMRGPGRTRSTTTSNGRNPRSAELKVTR
jgi:ABC-2 type transport system ATP-binding protein